MNTTSAQDEIVGYVTAVRAALAGLPPATVDEMLEDLPEHLAEVQAEGLGTLRDRLGSPEAYASELRATAGFVGGFPDPPAKKSWATPRDIWQDIEPVLRRADVRVGPVIGYERASEFLILLRPAWWVLRGYLAAMAVTVLFDDGHNHGLLPRIGGSTLLALIWLTGCVIGSILIGKRAGNWKPVQRYALWVATALLVLFMIPAFVIADHDTRSYGYETVSDYSGGNPYSGVQDVFVYDSQGHLVQGARLFDQDGSPIQFGSGSPRYCEDPQTGDSVQSLSLGYPYCPQNAPFASPSPSVSGSPSSAAPPSAGPSGSASPSPSVGRPSASSSGK